MTKIAICCWLAILRSISKSATRLTVPSRANVGRKKVMTVWTTVASKCSNKSNECFDLELRSSQNAQSWGSALPFSNLSTCATKKGHTNSSLLQLNWTHHFSSSLTSIVLRKSSDKTLKIEKKMMLISSKPFASKIMFLYWKKLCFNQQSYIRSFGLSSKKKCPILRSLISSVLKLLKPATQLERTSRNSIKSILLLVKSSTVMLITSC